MGPTTFITTDSIISKFYAYNEEYTVFTITPGVDDYKYQTFIRFSKYKKLLWNLYADNTTDAVVNHIALVDMANEHSVLHWNVKLLYAGKPMQFVDALHQKNTFAKDSTLNSTFTRKLFKAAGMNETQSEMGYKEIGAFMLACVLMLLGFGLNFN